MTAKKDADDWNHDHYVGCNMHGNGDNDENDAAFIAHHNPKFVMKLLKIIEVQAKALDRLTKVGPPGTAYSREDVYFKQLNENCAIANEAQSTVERILNGDE